MSFLNILQLFGPSSDDLPAFGFTTLHQVINLHKTATPLFILALMVHFDNFSMAAWLYLAIHGSYGLLWTLKYFVFPDKTFHLRLSPPLYLISCVVLAAYWVAPYLLISSGDVRLLPHTAGITVFIFTMGIFLHYASDCQKFYTLKYRPGRLIDEDLFAHCRNTNYLGEILIYSSFALLANHWLPWAINLSYWAVLFIPSMITKDNSLSRHAGFSAYKQRSGFLIPSFPSVSLTLTLASAEDLDTAKSL